MKTLRNFGIEMAVAMGFVAFVAWIMSRPLDAEFLAEEAIFVLLLVEYCLPKS